MSEPFELGLLALGTGAIYALLAMGLVLIFRGSGVLNLAQGAFAMLGAFLYNTFHADWDLGVWSAGALSVAVVMLIGLISDQGILRRLRDSSPLSRLIATVGILLICQSSAVIIWGPNLILVDSDISQKTVSFLGASITEDRFWLVGIACAIAALLTVIWRYTRIGWVTAAVAENPRSAAILGWSPEFVSALTWTIGGGLAAVAGILVAPITQLSVLTMSLLITGALAGALLGGFRSFSAALLGGMIVGVSQAEVATYVSVTGAADAVPLLIIVFVLVAGGSSLPLRGYVSDRLPTVGTGWIRPAAIAVAVVASLVLSQVISSSEWLAVLASTFAVATVLMSLVILVGFAGQLSLAQYALAGLGALFTSRLLVAQNWPFELAVLAGIVGTTLVGLVFALPALRTRGVNLAIVTLGLGVATTSVVFNNNSYTGGLSGTDVGSISLFGIDVSPADHLDRYVCFTAIVLLLCMWVTANVRRSATGRSLLAIRSNERAASAAGVNVFAAKLRAFAIAGAIAGFGGIAIGFQSTAVTFGQFGSYASLSAIALAVIGGIGFLLGPVVGAIFDPSSLSALIGRSWPAIDDYIPLVSGVGVILALMISPNGIVGEVTAALRRKTHRKPVEEIAETSDESPLRGEPASLAIREIRVTYGSVVAVDYLSVEVAPCEVVGLIGPNGSGKTSLMDAITGFTKCDGDVLLGEEAVGSWSSHRRARAGMSRSFQGLELFEDLTVLENLLVPGEAVAGRSVAADVAYPGPKVLSPAARAAVREFELEDCLDAHPDDLSYGQRRLVAIARSLAAQPKVLLLDEPAAGLDSAESAELAHLVRRLADEWGMGILVVEHDMSFVMTICDRVVVMDFGRKIADGTPDEVRDDPAAIAAYLGDDEEPSSVTPRAKVRA